MKIPQPKGIKGSLKWLQVMVNDHTARLDDALSKQLPLSDPSIQWLSPLKSDDYAEYRDGDFLDLLGLGKLKEQLREFWPRNGPQWDALGKGADGGPYFLVEAKANIPEIISSCTAKSDRSIAMIRKRLAEACKCLQCKHSELWENGFYQYANRLAHLNFLRNTCGVDAYLIFVYFLNDPTHIATTREQWEGALHLQKRLLGLKSHHLQKFVAEIFLDVKEVT